MDSDVMNSAYAILRRVQGDISAPHAIRFQSPEGQLIVGDTDEVHFMLFTFGFTPLPNGDLVFDPQPGEDITPNLANLVTRMAIHPEGEWWTSIHMVGLSLAA